jgi:hypothetical protein
VDIQAVLDLQNSVMRLGDPKKAGYVVTAAFLLLHPFRRLLIVDKDLEVSGLFNPRAFISDVLCQQIGPEVVIMARQASMLTIVPRRAHTGRPTSTQTDCLSLLWQVSGG